MYNVKMKAYEGDDDYIFVSYAHKDSDYVLPIIDNLHDLGYRIWFDEGIEASAEWPERIEDHMSRCAAVLAFVTEDFVESANCRKEITYSLNNHKPLIYVTPYDVKLGRGLDLQLADQQCINMSKMSEIKFYEKLASSGVMEGCRWKAPDGTIVKTSARRRRKKKKKKEWTTKEVIKTVIMWLFIATVVLVIWAVNYDDTGSGYSAKETEHSWVDDASGFKYCKGCGVQTGPLKGDQAELAGNWSTDIVKLEQCDSAYFEPIAVVENCYAITMSIKLLEVSGSPPYGEWNLYARDLKNNWIKVNTINITEEANDKAVSYDLTFSSPITFTGLAIARDPQGENWDMAYEIHYKGTMVTQK